MNLNIKRCILTLFVSQAILVAAASDKSQFSFAIIADPQVSGKQIKNEVAVNAWQTLERACNEINNQDVEFTLFLGDLVNVFEPKSLDCFRESISPLKNQLYLVQGNHDTRYPAKPLVELHQEYNPNINKAYYSFDVGEWHFVAMPCDFNLPDEFYEWLERDLEQNKKKNTIIFEHFHLLPLGLSQLEFYTFWHSDRNRVMDAITRHKSVKYYFNGHVHNGIKPYTKMSRKYRGINFVTVPTIIQSRPFGEEFEEYASGVETGGYYMTVHIDGDNVELHSHLVGNESVHIASQFPQIEESSIGILWFNTLQEVKPTPALNNGDFETGLEGWNLKYRYQRDEEPNFTYAIESQDENSQLYIETKAAYPPSWADDEYSEVYQVVKTGEELILSADYTNMGFNNGGAYIRVVLLNEQGDYRIFMFKWGENEADSSYVPRCWGKEVMNSMSSWNFLRAAGNKKQGIFINLEAPKGEQCHLNVDLNRLYNQAVKGVSSLSDFSATKALIGIGTWANRDSGSKSSAKFDNIRLGKANVNEKFSDLNIENPFHAVEFGLNLELKVKARKATNATK